MAKIAKRFSRTQDFTTWLSPADARTCISLAHSLMQLRAKCYGPLKHRRPRPFSPGPAIPPRSAKLFEIVAEKKVDLLSAQVKEAMADDEHRKQFDTEESLTQQLRADQATINRRLALILKILELPPVEPMRIEIGMVGDTWQATSDYEAAKLYQHCTVVMKLASTEAQARNEIPPNWTYSWPPAPISNIVELVDYVDRLVENWRYPFGRRPPENYSQTTVGYKINHAEGMCRLIRNVKAFTEHYELQIVPEFVFADLPVAAPKYPELFNDTTTTLGKDVAFSWEACEDIDARLTEVLFHLHEYSADAALQDIAAAPAAKRAEILEKWQPQVARKKKAKMSADRANEIAIAIAQSNPDFAKSGSARDWAKQIGCSLGLIPDLEFWQKCQGYRAPKEPRAVSADMVSYLIEDQRADAESEGRSRRPRV